MRIPSSEEFEELRLNVLCFTVKLVKNDFEECNAQDKDALCAIYRKIIEDQRWQHLYEASIALVGEALHNQLPENYLELLNSNLEKVARYHSQNAH